MASTYAVRVVEDSRISPPLGSVAQSAIPLTFFDVIWLSTQPVQRLLFYRFPHPPASFISSVLPNLKSSLSLALQHFYPLCGNLKRSDDKFEICYAEGDAVSFTLVEYDQDFDELSGSPMCDFTKVLPLIPQLPASADPKPLLAIQVTLFPCHGICIGVVIHHVCCDGSSSIHFLQSWASACRSGGLAPLVGPPPIYDRALIGDPRGLYSVFHNELTTRQLTGSGGLASEDDVIFAIFTLRPYQIQRLKNTVAAATDESKSFHCSTFVVSLAYVWVCLVKSHGYASKRIAHLLFPMDCRALLSPPVPASYFGNCLRPCFVNLKAGELIMGDGVVRASEAIGRAIEQSKKAVLRDAQDWIQKVMSFITEQPLSVAGSPKFRVYDTDFGWGTPQRVEVPSVQRTGAISLSESREDQGGVEIGLALQTREMAAFETHFCSALQQTKV